MVQAVSVGFGEGGNGRSLGSSNPVLRGVVLFIGKAEIKVIGGLELELFRDDGGLCVSAEHCLETGVGAVSIIGRCRRVSKCSRKAVKLRGVKLDGICGLVGFIVHAVHGRVHECLVVDAGIWIILVVA